jgi:ATP-dependent Lon protease
VIIPRENRKDLREVPRRVLKATRIVLVEHADEVLREALCLGDADALFGPPRESWEYVDGELVVKHGAKRPVAGSDGDGAQANVPPGRPDALPGATPSIVPSGNA